MVESGCKWVMDAMDANGYKRGPNGCKWKWMKAFLFLKPSSLLCHDNIATKSEQTVFNFAEQS